MTKAKFERDAADCQSAIAEILQVILNSPIDVQPVFDAIARNANRLCQGLFTGVFRFDGKSLHFGAHTNAQLTNVQARYPQRLDDGSALGRAIVERAVVHVADLARLSPTGTT